MAYTQHPVPVHADGCDCVVCWSLSQPVFPYVGRIKADGTDSYRQAQNQKKVMEHRYRFAKSRG